MTFVMTYDEVMEFLKSNGRAIGREAAEGDVLARLVVSSYSLHYRCPGDPGAQGVLMAVVEEYRGRDGTLVCVHT